MLVDVMDGADVRVIQGGRSPRLALEALERLTVGGKAFGKELEGDVPTQAKILRLVNDAHAAAAQLCYDPVMRDRSSDHEEGRHESAITR